MGFCPIQFNLVINNKGAVGLLTTLKFFGINNFNILDSFAGSPRKFAMLIGS